jgi:hypothetical protein
MLYTGSKGMMKNLGLFLISVFVTIGALAGDLKVNVDEVRVYSQPNPSSDVLTTLFKGDVVKTSNKVIPGFQKIKVESSNGSVIGYVKNSDLATKSVAKPGVPKSIKPTQQRRPIAMRSRGLVKNWAVFLTGGMNYQTQGDRTITTSDGSTDVVSSLSGLSTIFGLTLQFPLSESMAGKLFFDMKSVAVTGSATYQATAGVAATPSDFILREQFLTFGGGIQYYFSKFWWGGAGMQIDKVNSGTIKAGGTTEVSLTSSDLTMFFGAYASTGYDFALFKNIYLTPEVKFVFLFSKPLIFEGDFVLNLGYSF